MIHLSKPCDTWKVQFAETVKASLVSEGRSMKQRVFCFVLSLKKKQTSTSLFFCKTSSGIVSHQFLSTLWGTSSEWAF